MNALLEALEGVNAIAKIAALKSDSDDARIAQLEAANGDLLDEVHDLRTKLGAAPTDPPTALPVSIALAQAAKANGLTIQQARALFAAVTPAEASTISAIARAERDRAAEEDVRRKVKRSSP